MKEVFVRYQRPAQLFMPSVPFRHNSYCNVNPWHISSDSYLSLYQSSTWLHVIIAPFSGSIKLSHPSILASHVMLRYMFIARIDSHITIRRKSQLCSGRSEWMNNEQRIRMGTLGTIWMVLLHIKGPQLVTICPPSEAIEPFGRWWAESRGSVDFQS